MKVADILRVKGNTLFTVPPEQPLAQAARTMAEEDIGSLVVMDHGDLTGMLTFREVIKAVVEAQDFENRMLKAYIRDWPVEAQEEPAGQPPAGG